MELTASDFPEVSTVSPEEVVATHRSITIAPKDREDLSFSLSLPNDWRDDPAAASPPGDGANWTTLAVFARRPPGPEWNADHWGVVSVLWQKLPFEVRLDEWTAAQLLGMRMEIHTIRLWSDPRGIVIDAGTTGTGSLDARSSTQSQIPTVMRIMVRSDGPDVFAVIGMATPSAYPSMIRDFIVAGASFALKRNPIGLAEPIQAAAASNPNFQVAHLLSWIHQPQLTPPGVTGKSALNLVLVIDNLLKGLVRIKAVDMRVARAVSTESLLNDAADELGQAEIHMKQPWTPLEDPIIRSIPNLTEAHVSTGLLQTCTYELHFATVRADPIVFCITALALPMQQEPISSMRAHRAYEIALRSVQPI
jgi:hypothetical protein